MSGIRTFGLPESVDGSHSALGREMISAWQADGICQIGLTRHQVQKLQDTFDASRRFFAEPASFKTKCVSDLTYAGYIASGEEVTAGEADLSEIFTVCQDIPLSESRVRAKWPCHGPVPWPSAEYRRAMQSYMTELGGIGDRVLRLIALGLDLPADTLTNLADDGWHHMRVLRFPAASERGSRGIGAHTDYGMLVIAAQDDVGGLFVRPPVAGEHRNRNWLDTESTAGMYEDDEPWTFVEPVANVLTVFPGDILQFLTADQLLSTPHKVRLADRERYTMAYFHEPNFNTTIRPLTDGDDKIHYGTHFTNMFMRCYPDRITTQRIVAEDRLKTLAALAEKSAAA